MTDRQWQHQVRDGEASSWGDVLDRQAEVRRAFSGPEIALSGSRQLVADVMAEWGIAPAVVEDGRVVTSELVTNSITHGYAQRVNVEVVDLDDHVLVVVEHLETDRAGRPRPVPQSPLASSTSGRGLAIVDALAVAWGHDEVWAGSRTWCVLAAPRSERSPPGRPLDETEGDAAVMSLRASVVRSQLLLRLAEGLSGARTTQEVADTSTSHAKRIFGATFAGVIALDHEHRTLRHLDAARTPDPTAAGWIARTLAPDGAAAKAVSERAASFHETRAALLARFPHLADSVASADLAAFAHLPLSSEGRVVGALLLGWRRGRVISGDDRALMSAISGYTAVALHRATVAEEHEQVAAALQAALLPQHLPIVPHVQLAARYRPVAHNAAVGGDWYDAFVLPNGHLCLVIGDVAGHGIAAARTMGKLRFVARAHAIAGESPEAILENTNALLRFSEVNLIASMLYLDYDPQHHILRWANAGHPPAVLVSNTGGTELIGTATGPVLGALEKARYAAAAAVIAADSSLVLYTDGLVEHRESNIDDDIAILARATADALDAGLDAEGVADELLRQRDLSGPQEDDVCLMVVALRDSATSGSPLPSGPGHP